MKKTAILCLTLLFTCLLFAACTGTNTPNVTDDTSAHTEALPDTRTAEELAAAIVAQCDFSEALTKNDSYLSYHLFDFASLADSYTDCAAYIPVGITPEEVLVFLARDEAAAKALCDKLNAYIDYQASEYGDYKPSEVPKLDGAVVIRKGNTVVYVVSTDNAAAQDTVNDILG